MDHRMVTDQCQYMGDGAEDPAMGTIRPETPCQQLPVVVIKEAYQPIVDLLPETHCATSHIGSNSVDILAISHPLGNICSVLMSASLSLWQIMTTLYQRKWHIYVLLHHWLCQAGDYAEPIQIFGEDFGGHHMITIRR